MSDKWRLNRLKLQVFSTISFVLVIFVLLFTDSFISNFSLQLVASESNGRSSALRLKSHKVQRPLESKLTREPRESLVLGQEDVTLQEEDHGNSAPAPDITNQERVAKSRSLTRRFDDTVREFLGNQCRIQFFYTWISPVENFGEREFSAMESIFKAHPDGCLVILSESMDSLRGQKIVKPLVDQGYRILAVAPDFSFLLKNTPGEAWFNDIKRGKKDPGRIPLAQNLSNLIRLAVLYKYGGVYLDTDFIVLKDFSGLKNSIGAQGVNMHGNWTILNNAVLVFDKNHPILYKFMEEFASTFDGNRWGHNGPYLVTRVLQRVAPGPEFNYTVLAAAAFYPTDWIKIAGFFVRPNDSRMHSRWMEAKLIQLRGSYGLHLWNRETKTLRIEDGSIIGRLISDHCVICKNVYSS